LASYFEIVLILLKAIEMIEFTQYIELDNTVLSGKPVIKNTRISVEMILEKLAQGQSEADLLIDYPRLTHEAIKACIGFAAYTISEIKTYPIAS
jgi:uncharacterized protein (DUF433 family)